MTLSKPNVGAGVVPTRFLHVDGGICEIGQPKQRWSVLFVYRGRHCPRCKRYLNKLNDQLSDWTAKMNVIVLSADTKDKAVADREEFEWRFDLCYGLTVSQMRDLGLYVSDPLSKAETDQPFAEPGMFAMRPDGSLMLADISNGPAARPDLDELLDGMIFNIDNDRPVRGTA